MLTMRRFGFLFFLVSIVLLLGVTAIDAPVAVAAETTTADAGWLAGVLEVLPDWLQALGILVSGAAAIAALTPTPKDDGILLVIRKIIDFLALNIGGARNDKSSKNSDRLT